MAKEKDREMVSFIIPAYNEEERILETLNEIYDFFSGIPNEILVVMDGCTDGTPGIVSEFSKDRPTIRSIHNPKKLGKGGGILLGLSKACGNIIAVIDADGAVPASDLGRMVDMISENADCIISSRYLPGSVIRTPQPVHRVFAGRCFNVLIRVLFGLPFKDTQCGCKVIKSEVAREVAREIRTCNYAFDVELLWRIRNKGYRIEEVPVEWRHRQGSKLDMKKVIPEMFTAVLKLRLKR